MNHANGQVATSATSILAGTALTTEKGGAQRVSMMFTNVGGLTEALVITVLRDGGTARRVARFSLANNETAYIVSFYVGIGDTVKAATTNASSVDYTIEGGSSGPLQIFSLDANGALRSGSGGLSGSQTFSDDVNFKNSTGATFEAWDASDVTALWANAPSRITCEPFVFYEMFDDFMNPATSAVSDVQAWTPVNDGGTGTPVFQDAAGGILNVVTAAADNDYSAYSSFAEMFKFASGKKLWFEARFKLSEATTNESAWWFGLTDTLTTGGFQADASGPLASYDGALIWKDEATMAIDFETSNAGTQATTTAMATFVSNTWTRVGFYFDGTATTSVITPYYEVTGVDGTALTAGTPQNITLSGLEEMHVVFGVKAGPTAAAETLQIDYIRCVQLR